MEKIFEQISIITNSKRVIQAEFIIMNIIKDINENFNLIKNELEFEKLKLELINLLLINNGNLSSQCSIYIANCLLKVFEKMKSPQIWDLINITIEKNYSSLIFASGYIFRYIGLKFKSQIPRFVEFLCSNIKNNELSSIYALRSSFKAGGNVLNQYINLSFEYIKKCLNNSSQTIQIISIKCLRT